MLKYVHSICNMWIVQSTDYNPWPNKLNRTLFYLESKSQWLWFCHSSLYADNLCNQSYNVLLILSAMLKLFFTCLSCVFQCIITFLIVSFVCTVVWISILATNGYNSFICVCLYASGQNICFYPSPYSCHGTIPSNQTFMIAMKLATHATATWDYIMLINLAVCYCTC